MIECAYPTISHGLVKAWLGAAEFCYYALADGVDLANQPEKGGTTAQRKLARPTARIQLKKWGMSCYSLLGGNRTLYR